MITLLPPLELYKDIRSIIYDIVSSTTDMFFFSPKTDCKYVTILLPHRFSVVIFFTCTKSTGTGTVTKKGNTKIAISSIMFCHFFDEFCGNRGHSFYCHPASPIKSRILSIRPIYNTVRIKTYHSTNTPTLPVQRWGMGEKLISFLTYPGFAMRAQITRRINRVLLGASSDISPFAPFHLRTLSAVHAGSYRVFFYTKRILKK